jgi:hypothetical protein
VSIPLIVLAVLLLGAAAKGVVDMFYTSPTSEALAREASGRQLIGRVALLMLPLAAGLAVVRMRWSAAGMAAASAAFLVVVGRPDQSLATYAMVPVAALLLACAVAADLVGSATDEMTEPAAVTDEGWCHLSGWVRRDASGPARQS